MTVLTIAVVDQTFEKKSSEVQYLLRVLDLLKNEIGRSQGKATSGTIIGVSPTGVPNTSLGLVGLHCKRNQRLRFLGIHRR